MGFAGQLRGIRQENHFNKILTGETVRAAIKSDGNLKFKEWAFEPTIPRRLKEETNAYLQTYTPFGAGGETIVRDQINSLVKEIVKPNGPELILLTGIAGSGKSGIVRGAIEQLSKNDIPLLSFRIDHHLSCHTREELGKKLTGREESPVSTLNGGLSNLKRSVLTKRPACCVTGGTAKQNVLNDYYIGLVLQ